MKTLLLALSLSRQRNALRTLCGMLVIHLCWGVCIRPVIAVAGQAAETEGEIATDRSWNRKPFIEVLQGSTEGGDCLVGSPSGPEDATDDPAVDRSTWLHDIIDCLHNKLLEAQGAYDNAREESLLRLLVTVYEYGPPGDSSRLQWALALRKLGHFGVRHQRFQEALVHFETALRLDEVTLGQADSGLIPDLVGVGIATAELNELELAEKAFLRAHSISLEVNGLYHPQTARTFNNLGLLYGKMGDKDKAREYTYQSLKIREQVTPNDSLGIATSLLNVAGSFAYDKHDFRQAEALYLRAIAYREACLGPDHPKAGNALKNLALMYRFEKNLVATEALLPRILAIARHSSLSDHSDAAETYEMMSECARARGVVESALIFAEAAFEIRFNLLEIDLRQSAESQVLFRARMLEEPIGTYLSALFDLANPADSVLQIAANMVVRSKGVVYRDAVMRHNRLTAEPGRAEQSILDSLDMVRGELASAYVRSLKAIEPQAEPDQHLDSLASAKQRWEIALKTFNSTTYGSQAGWELNWKEGEEHLPSQTVLVEYFVYRRLVRDNPYVRTDRYGAIVTGPGGLHLLDLADADTVNGRIHELISQAVQLSRSAHYPNESDYHQYLEAANELFHWIWEPVAGHVPGNMHVFVIPDGELSILPLGALPTSDTGFLLESVPIHYLSSISDLAGSDEQDATNRGLLLVGDPDFDAPQVSSLSACDAVNQQDRLQQLSEHAPWLSRCAASLSQQLSGLPGSRSEIATVAEAWKGATSDTLIMLEGQSASESCLMAHSPEARVIHLATHGFYLGGACSEEGSAQSESTTGHIEEENPYLLSGLFLVGSNHVSEQDADSQTDGVLTAEEVATMDLQNVDLVVLSACESGSGTVVPGEVVYGLRRAFRVAGVRSVVSSLWPLPDNDAAEIISAIYQSSDKPLPWRLRTSQLNRLQWLRRSGFPPHPYLWASMISEGDWRIRPD